MIEPKIIKTEEQYRAYLAEVDRLAADDPASGTSAGDRLELLAKLVEDYEKERFTFSRPDPIEAILFPYPRFFDSSIAFKSAKGLNVEAVNAFPASVRPSESFSLECSCSWQ